MSATDKPQETIENFIKRHALIFTYSRIHARPDKGTALTDDDKRWQRDAFHFVVSFAASNGEAFSTFYSMGKGNGRQMRGAPHGTMEAPIPKGPEVLDALLSDAESWDNARKAGASSSDIDTFARDMGYDTDEPAGSYGSRRPRPSFIERYRECERTFNACGEAFAALSRLLGDSFAALRDCERM